LRGFFGDALLANLTFVLRPFFAAFLALSAMLKYSSFLPPLSRKMGWITRWWRAHSALAMPSFLASLSTVMEMPVVRRGPGNHLFA
jgi:hypothetical protein